MKFDSTEVHVDGKDIVIVAVDTHFFSLSQEEKNELVRNFFGYFKKPLVLMAVNPAGDMQYYGRPDLTAMVANLQFSEYQWQTNEIETS